MTMTHKEKDELIKELKEKLKEVKHVEKQLNATSAELPAPGVGLHKNEKGQFFLYELKFDPETKAAAVVNVIDLYSSDPSIATFKLKEYVIEKVFRKVDGGKYV